MRRQEFFQLKRKQGTNKIEMNNLLDKELKALVITMLTRIKNKRIDGHNENFNKEAEKNYIYIYKDNSEVKNKVSLVTQW